MGTVDIRIYSRKEIAAATNRQWTTKKSAMELVNAEANGQDFADELWSLARRHWFPEGKKKLPKFNAKVVDQIFNGLNERSFPLKELLVLDQTLYLDKYVKTIPLSHY